MKIAIAADHAGFEMKCELINWLMSSGKDVIDFGTDSLQSVDYPDFAFAAAVAVRDHIADVGIILCGTGIGVSITANKVEGIRAANCCSPEMAKLAKEHNNANVLNLGARLLTIEQAKEIITVFLITEFMEGRHQSRLEKLHKITGR